MIEFIAGQPNAKNIRVWLDGEEVTNLAFYALASKDPGVEVVGKVGMYVKEDGQFKTEQFGSETLLVEEHKEGIVKWERIEA